MTFFCYEKGRAIHSGALVLAFAKIQDIFQNIPDIRKGLFLGMESGIFSSILIAEVRRGHPGCKILHYRLTPYPEKTPF